MEAEWRPRAQAVSSEGHTHTLSPGSFSGGIFMASGVASSRSNSGPLGVLAGHFAREQIILASFSSLTHRAVVRLKHVPGTWQEGQELGK